MSEKIPVLYGTETGNAEECAEELADAISELGWNSEAIDLDDFEPSDIHELKLVFIVSSTHGNGDPPENAEALMFYLEEDDVVLNNVHYAVCALGDRAYPHFAQCGKDFDRHMEARGGIRVLPRIDCDADFEVPFSEFKKSVVDFLTTKNDFVSQILGLSGEPAVNEQPSETVKEEPTGTRNNPYLGKLLVRRKLSQPGSAKETMHYEIDLGSSAIQYQSGDCIGVYPTNNGTEVSQILSAIRCTGEEVVNWKESSGSLRDLLTHTVCLQRVTVDLLHLFADDSGPAQEAVWAGQAATTKYIADNHVLDVVKTHQKSLDAQRFATCLRRIQPRLYSIASSPTKYPTAVHFTIETLRYDWNNRATEGVASTWFADRLDLNAGESIPLYLHSNPKFRLPTDDRPIIMIGPGTGIAPFRAFLQEKEAGGFSGPAWLFFGHQHEACDYLYKDDLQRYHQQGVLNRLDLAWSRDQDAKVYVQDKMRANKSEIWAWLQKGANIYVCGDANNMAVSVDETLREIARDYGRDPEQFIKELERDMRYQRDVY